MDTNKENRRENQGSGAGRDGKRARRPRIHQADRGTRGGSRFESRSREGGSSYQPRRHDSGSYERRDSYRSEGRRDSYRSEGRRESFRSEGRRDSYRSEGRRDSFRPDNRRSSYEQRPRRYDRDNRQEPARLSFKKPGDSESRFIESRHDRPRSGGTSFRKRSDYYSPHAKYSHKKQVEYKQSFIDPTKPIRLNRFLANAGICSRREADEFIQAGVISVNGETVTELGVKVLPTDNVMFHNQLVNIEKKVYILLNKPKNYVTTTEDTHGRKTVMDLVKYACSERVYPVGRLDRNTTGVLLLTNDGDLASRLTHPKFEKKKIYHVGISDDLTAEHYDKILTGIDLGDYTIKADALEFVKDGSLREIGIEIHSGQNRVVRRIFESLGYKITKLDRVYFAGLTKKQVPRGKYRFLSEKEVSFLRMSNGE